MGMNNKNPILALRRQLLDKGYSPLANRDKACYLPNWPRIIIDENVIKKWSRMHNTDATGLRVENGLCVIDIDVDHAIIEDVIDAMLDVLPDDAHPYRLERAGKGYKLAWYCQSYDHFSRLHTRRWLAPDDTEDDATHAIEIFGGGSPRQFGSFGAHTLKDGKAVIEYQWTEETPADVPLSELTVLTKEQLFQMLDAAEAELKVQGFTPVARTKRGEGTPGRVYDLTEAMTFDLDDGRTLTLDELQDEARNGLSCRCSASWLEGGNASNTQRCLVTSTSAGHLAIWESAESITHMAAALQPADLTDEVNRLAEKLRERADSRRTRMNAEDDHLSGAAKLLGSHAYMPTAREVVRPLWSVSDGEGTTLQNFRTLHMPYCGVEIGPRGGEKKINPVDVWLANPNRIVVAGERMRPDLPRPTFDINGQTYINTYRPPDLGSTDGGMSDGGEELIKQLVPNERERAWFTQWLAYKWKNPHVPGASVIMVARKFGTGRGTFGVLLKKLFGDRYVTNVPFKIFAGMNYQSQYTDWGLDALFAIVNESSASDGGSTYKAKHDVYEHLKEVIEPRAVERTYIRKGEGSVRAVASTTCMIMTNNPDAIPLPSDDRRFAVLTNGDDRPPEFWNFINQWMDRSANIAAFAQWLEAINIVSFDPYAQPPMTIGKEEMSDLNRSPLDKLLYDAVSTMEGYFVVDQVLRKMTEAELRMRANLPNGWREIASKAVRKLAHIVRYEDGQRMRPQIAGRRYEVFHRDRGSIQYLGGAKELRNLLVVNGNVFGDENAVSEKLNLHLRLVDGSNNDP